MVKSLPKIPRIHSVQVVCMYILYMYIGQPYRFALMLPVLSHSITPTKLQIMKKATNNMLKKQQ